MGMMVPSACQDQPRVGDDHRLACDNDEWHVYRLLRHPKGKGLRDPQSKGWYLQYIKSEGPPKGYEFRNGDLYLAPDEQPK